MDYFHYHHYHQHHHSQTHHHRLSGGVFATRLIKTGTLLALYYSLGVHSFTSSTIGTPSSNSFSKQQTLADNQSSSLSSSSSSPFLTTSSSLLPSSPSSKLISQLSSFPSSSQAQIWSMLCSTYGHHLQTPQIKQRKQLVKRHHQPIEHEQETDLDRHRQKPLYTYLLSKAPNFFSASSSPSPLPLIETTTSSPLSTGSSASPPALYYNYNHNNNQLYYQQKESSSSNSNSSPNRAEPAESSSQRLKRQSVNANTPWDLIK